MEPSNKQVIKAWAKGQKWFLVTVISSLWTDMFSSGVTYAYQYLNMKYMENCQAIQFQLSKAKSKIKDLKRKMVFGNQRAIKSNTKDQGWAWVIVIASLTSHMLNDGVIYSYGVLTTEFINHFEISRSTVGFMGSILTSITYLMAPLASYLCNRFSYRTVAIVGSLISSVGFAAPYFYNPLWFVILCSSVVCGVGFGLVYLPSIMIINIWFEKKRSLAIGIAVCGAGLGTFVLSSILENLIKAFGWQLTMLITGGMLLILVPCSLTYVNIDSDNADMEDQKIQNESPTEKQKIMEEELSLLNIEDIEYGYPEGKDVNSETKSYIAVKKILKNPIFFIIMLSNILVMFSYNAPYMFVKDRAIEYGISTSKGSFLISSIGIGNCIGRVGFGYIAGLRFFNRFHLYVFAIIMSGASLIISWWMSSYISMIVYTVCYGIMSGSYITLTPVILVDVFGLELLSITFSIILICDGIAVFIGPPFVGWIYDATISYNISFAICGAIIAASGLMMYLSYLSKEFRKKKFTS